MSEQQMATNRGLLILRPLVICVVAAIGTGTTFAAGVSAEAYTAATTNIPSGGLGRRPMAVLPVTSCADDGSSGTLRSVVAGAASGDTVDLSALRCSTITLTQGAITIDVDDLSLQGPGASSLTIDGANANRVIAHHGYGTLAISDVTVAYGRYISAHTSVPSPGGCVYSAGSVALTDATVSHCLAGQITPTVRFAPGGGIYAAGDLTLVGSTISDSTALGNFSEGGGAAAGARSDFAHVVIRDSTISGNTAYGGSGLVLCPYITVRPTCTFSMYNSTISDNSTYISYYGPGYGAGGAALIFGDTLISNSTISGNYAGNFGGGLFVEGSLTMHNSTVAFNIGNYGAGGVEWANDNPAYLSDLQSSIIADNVINHFVIHAADLAGDVGTTIDGANNLIGSSDFVLPPDTLGGDPMLGPLQDNGGVAWTHALLPGSPAINAGNNVDDLDFDQRGIGFRRVFDASTDIGAFERQIVPSNRYRIHGP